MMSRGNMGKQVATAPKSKKVKKMMMGGMAEAPMMPQVMKKGGKVKPKSTKGAKK
jgi:hypothetical protein